MMCGLVGSLPTVTDMLALSADPPAVGVKVTAIVQAELGDAVVVQVLVGEIVKSDPLGPLMLWANDSGNPDRLVTVTVLVFVGVLEVSVPYASVAGRRLTASPIRFRARSARSARLSNTPSARRGSRCRCLRQR
jgi:hypothetical protein